MRMARLSISIGIFMLVVLGCNGSAPPPPAAPVATQFNTGLTMRQLMDWVLDPTADAVWASVGTIITAEGQQDIAPKTDEEWNAVRNNAALLIEAGNLLMLEGRAVNQQDWINKARAMSDAAKVVLEAAQVKDAAAVFTAGSDMYLTCSACHAVYIFADEQTTAEKK
ncbi:MAG: hypothetical protein H7Y02_11615 [Candidatus Obscuribacterales bacterium]|nr:hypothetical protein [Steroidobacteraceae bacterium]